MQPCRAYFLPGLLNGKGKGRKNLLRLILELGGMSLQNLCLCHQLKKFFFHVLSSHTWATAPDPLLLPCLILLLLYELPYLREQLGPLLRRPLLPRG